VCHLEDLEQDLLHLAVLVDGLAEQVLQEAIRLQHVILVTTLALEVVMPFLRELDSSLMNLDLGREDLDACEPVGDHCHCKEE